MAEDTMQTDTDLLTDDETPPADAPTQPPATPPAPAAPATPSRTNARQPERRDPAPSPAAAPVIAEDLDPAKVKRFTQVELDERIGKARNEGRSGAYRYIGKELGVPVVNEDGSINLADLRTLVEQARNGNMQATQRIQELDANRQELEGRLSEKDSEIQGALVRAQQALRLGEAKAAATMLNFSDPRDAIALLGDLSQFEADLDNGQVKGLEEALRKLAEQKPYLLRTAATNVPPPPIPPTPAPTDGRGRQADIDEEALQTVRSQARTFF